MKSALDDNNDDDGLSEQARRVAAVVAEAREKRAAGAKAPTGSAPSRPSFVDIGAVDVDVCLSLSQGDVAYTTAEADAIFDAIDTDADGKISKDELRAHLAGTVLMQKDAVKRVFTLVDIAPADGSIDRAELRRAFSRYECSTLRLALGLATGTRHSLRPEELEGTKVRSGLADEVFAVIDTNDDERISPAELRAHLAASGLSLSPTTADAMFAALDINSNGEIDREELRDAFERYEYSAVRLALGLVSQPTIMS